MNLSMESFIHVSPPRPGGGVVNGVKLSFLQAVVTASRPMISTERICRNVFIYSNFFSLNDLLSSMAYRGFNANPALTASGGNCKTLLGSPVGMVATTALEG